ncbi:MAG TPA: enoyl-CoA hydratase-related protein [Aliidongia sp.]|uniref:enoyl-CoA hydratase/isomerase family protein n=1 Tax=Aliidongia sp. TaxID=1914230 RepID=UPI002DDCE239|nr:enoyl-CoA hydratase-related protein [Aliidongia sp.]HEV2673040.1 enoyl-CoA hydratase-related protein [Aliidongia sp.]
MTVTLSFREEIAVIVLDRPAALNALSFEVLKRLDDAFVEVAASAARALVVTGAGPKAFCAGADIAELRNRSLMDQKRGAEFGQRVFSRLNALPIASIAVINGYAFGGGLEMALAATFRIVLPQAKLGLPEIKLGLIPGYGGTQRLPRLVGEARALEIIMTGRTVTANEAVAIGLANRLVEGDPVEAGLAFAREFTGFGLPALAMAREAVTRALDVPLQEGLRIEADLSTLAYQTSDAEEGMSAFLEKRQPQFRDA